MFTVKQFKISEGKGKSRYCIFTTGVRRVTTCTLSDVYHFVWLSAFGGYCHLEQQLLLPVHKSQTGFEDIHE